jgi:hypothetical protein
VAGLIYHRGASPAVVVAAGAQRRNRTPEDPMAKTYVIKNPKNKDAPDISVDINTSADDLAGFAKLGYEVAEAKKAIAADKDK